MTEIYFPDDIWNIIRSFTIFNIKKDGNHIKKDKYHLAYQNCLHIIKHYLLKNCETEKPFMVKYKKNTKKIIDYYNNDYETYTFIKYIYIVKYNNIRILIKEHTLLDISSKVSEKKYAPNTYDYYLNIYNNHNIYKKCHCLYCSNNILF